MKTNGKRCKKQKKSKKQKNKDSQRTIYQIAQFKHPSNGKYHIRKYIIKDDCSEMICKEGYISLEKVNSLMNRYKRNRYTVFPVYNLQQIAHPSMGEILNSGSQLMEGEHNYTGHSLF